MTGRNLIENFLASYSFTEKETVGKALSYCIDEELHKISDGKLDLDKELTSKDLEQLIDVINRDLRTGDIWDELLAAADIIDADVLKFFAEYPNYLADVEDLLTDRSDNFKLLDIFKAVFAEVVAQRIVVFRDYELQEAVGKAEKLEEWSREEER